jgi:hypothetical protein
MNLWLFSVRSVGRLAPRRELLGDHRPTREGRECADAVEQPL